MGRGLEIKRLARFVFIGTCNATISFGMLNLLFYKFHQPKILSSIISTSCALIFSFIMNRGFVFGQSDKRVREQLPQFLIVTISGSLLLLNLVYIASIKLLNGHEHLIIQSMHSLTSVTLTRNFVDINVSTVFGAIAALVWNYEGYKKFVFKNVQEASEEAIEHTP